VLNGLPGRGKTTLLNHLLRDRQWRGRRCGERVREIGIDHLLVEKLDENTVAERGCLCCTVRGDLTRVVAGDAAPGAPRRDQPVVIETTGLAEPVRSWPRC